MADKIIIVKKRSSCSSGCAIIGAALVIILIVCMKSCFNTIREADRKYAERQAAMTPEERAAAAIAKPPIDAVTWKFAEAIRADLNDPDSYKPGVIREGAHPSGYAYFQEFRAKNAFGAYMKSEAGLLAKTNSGTLTWVYYPPDRVPTLLSIVLQKQASDHISTNSAAQKFKNDVEKAQRNIESR